MNDLSKRIERIKEWLSYNSESPDRHISEHRKTYVSLSDIRALVEAAENPPGRGE